jgi:hypothetical protein
VGGCNRQPVGAQPHTPVAPGFSVPVAAGDTFPVHYTDLDQPGLADAFAAQVEDRAITIVETSTVPAFH